MRSSITTFALASLLAVVACNDADPISGPDREPFAPSYTLVAGDYCDGATMPASECMVLVQLYNTTGGDGWNQPVAWGVDPNPCNWWGVTCTDVDHGSVQQITLTGDGLVGPFPPELGTLSSLTHLRLGINDLTGSLPESLSNLQNLVELQVTSNHLSGPVPAWLGDMPNLQSFFALGNDFSGPLPPELGNSQSLLYVIVAHNQLSGTIPEELAGMGSLVEFVASGNAFSGVLPLAVAALAETLPTCELVPNGGGLSMPDIQAYRTVDADGSGDICGLPFSSAEDVGEDAVGGIDDLVPDPLNEGLANALSGKIESAMAKAAAGQYQVAINLMEAFIAQVEDLVVNGVLTQEEAEPLLQQAEALIALWTAQL